MLSGLRLQNTLLIVVGEIRVSPEVPLLLRVCSASGKSQSWGFFPPLYGFTHGWDERQPGWVRPGGTAQLHGRAM